MKKVNEVSRLTGVSKRTLQYYDEEGLLQVERSEDNYRLYQEADLEKVWQILIYKEMGFQLKEIKYLLVLSDMERGKYLEQKMETLFRKIRRCKEQIELIERVKTYGMFPVPMEEKCNDLTYVKLIEQLKEKSAKNHEKGRKRHDEK